MKMTFLARCLSPSPLTHWEQASYDIHNCTIMRISGDHRPASLSSLSDDERTLALARFQILRPFLEDGVPLARVAREQNVILRTARRWVRRYRREGLGWQP
jgi:hypothetical protein